MGFPDRPDAGSILPLLHLVERPAIVRPVYLFVKTQTTTYCAHLLGQPQYVDCILAQAEGAMRGAMGLKMLGLAAAVELVHAPLHRVPSSSVASLAALSASVSAKT